MPPRKTTRSSTAMTVAGQEEAQPPAVDLNHLKVLLELLVKSAARQHGIPTVDAGIEDIKAQLDAALAQQEVDEEVGEDEDGDEEEEETDEKMGEVRRRAVL